MEKLKAAVSGFRHGHVTALAAGLKAHPDVEIVASAEEEPGKCREIIEKCGLEITHDSLDAMLGGEDFDILVLGDYYAARGRQAIKGLEAGKHILSDKPLCTRTIELEKIRELSRAKNLAVIVALTLRYIPLLQTAKRLLSGKIIGEPANIIITGHHGLMFRSGRPGWYFEDGKHGGTINDIMVHGIDAASWLCGIKISSVLSALTGHFEPDEAPFFQDVGKALMRLENGGGVFIDVSYKAPAGHPSGWEFSLWGTAGFMQFKTSGEITVRRHNEPGQNIASGEAQGGGFVDDLVGEIRKLAGREPVLTTGECLLSTYNALKVQEAADTGKCGVGLG